MTWRQAGQFPKLAKMRAKIDFSKAVRIPSDFGVFHFRRQPHHAAERCLT
jgi:hypothetical protein